LKISFSFELSIPGSSQQLQLWNYCWLLLKLQQFSGLYHAEIPGNVLLENFQTIFEPFFLLNGKEKGFSSQTKTVPQVASYSKCLFQVYLCPNAKSKKKCSYYIFLKVHSACSAVTADISRRPYWEQLPMRWQTPPGKSRETCDNSTRIHLIEGWTSSHK
jgi:hypothetical protein